MRGLFFLLHCLHKLNNNLTLIAGKARISCISFGGMENHVHDNASANTCIILTLAGSITIVLLTVFIASISHF